jgi:hypothetical protein
MGKNPIYRDTSAAEEEAAMDQFREETGSEYHVKVA